MKYIPLHKLTEHIEKMKPGERLEFVGQSVGRQFTEILVIVGGSGIKGQYPLQDDRQKPEELFAEHMAGLASYGKLDVKGLHAVLERQIY